MMGPEFQEKLDSFCLRYGTRENFRPFAADLQELIVMAVRDATDYMIEQVGGTADAAREIKKVSAGKVGREPL